MDKFHEFCRESFTSKNGAMLDESEHKTLTTFLYDVYRPDLLPKNEDGSPIETRCTYFLRDGEGAEDRETYSIKKIMPVRKTTVDAATGLLRVSGRTGIKDAYISGATYYYSRKGVYDETRMATAHAMCVDIDGIGWLYNEKPEDREAALKDAFPEMFEELAPSYIIATGKKGVQLIYCFEEDVFSSDLRVAFRKIQRLIAKYFDGDAAHLGYGMIRLPFSGRLSCNEERVEDPYILCRPGGTRHFGEFCRSISRFFIKAGLIRREITAYTSRKNAPTFKQVRMTKRALDMHYKRFDPDNYDYNDYARDQDYYNDDPWGEDDEDGAYFSDSSDAERRRKKTQDWLDSHTQDEINAMYAKQQKYIHGRTMRMDKEAMFGHTIPETPYQFMKRATEAYYNGKPGGEDYSDLINDYDLPFEIEGRRTDKQKIVTKDTAAINLHRSNRVHDIFTITKLRHGEMTGHRNSALFLYASICVTRIELNTNEPFEKLEMLNREFTEPLKDSELKSIIKNVQIAVMRLGHAFTVGDIRMAEMLGITDAELPFLLNRYTEEDKEQHRKDLAKKRNTGNKCGRKNMMIPRMAKVAKFLRHERRQSVVVKRTVDQGIASRTTAYRIVKLLAKLFAKSPQYHSGDYNMDMKTPLMPVFYEWLAASVHRIPVQGSAESRAATELFYSVIETQKDPPGIIEDAMAEWPYNKIPDYWGFKFI